MHNTIIQDTNIPKIVRRRSIDKTGLYDGGCSPSSNSVQRRLWRMCHTSGPGQCSKRDATSPGVRPVDS